MDRRIIFSFIAALVLPAAAATPGSLAVSGELKQWHKVTVTLEGPEARERGGERNPFLDYEFAVVFTHESGTPRHEVPGYFAADGKAAETSAGSGSKWRAHLAPGKPGKWLVETRFREGKEAAINPGSGEPVAPYHECRAEFTVGPSDKGWPDFRGRGRLQVAGKHHLRFAGDGSWFLKAGADAPETLLAYRDFDGTRANKPKKGPLKTYAKHERDWTPGDPTWRAGKGKGLVGALNYLSAKGMNAFSFLPYNAGGDGDNVWPFVERDDTFHYDCSKLDQWGIVFDHATSKGLFLHFKLQETENDDNRRGHPGNRGEVPTALDGGALGPERKLYCRELVARFAHNLALNWNLGEENTQSAKEQKDMARWIRRLDPYDHPIVLHTFPDQQDKVYRAHLGEDSVLDGLSLQNSNVKNCHGQVVKWVRESRESGHPWIVSFDEPGDAQFGMPPDDDYGEMGRLRESGKARKAPTVHDVRKYTLWGTILAGGGGVEYYFGYKLPENDLVAEDWRSRDASWDYARHCLEFFRNQEIPFWDMANRDDLVGNPDHSNSHYCFAREGEVYLVYLPTGGSVEFQKPAGNFTLQWFNPREGSLQGEAAPLAGTRLTAPDGEDWLAVIRK